jgi:hypothetical protein
MSIPIFVALVEGGREEESWGGVVRETTVLEGV